MRVEIFLSSPIEKHTSQQGNHPFYWNGINQKNILKNHCLTIKEDVKEGAYWGAVAGVYVGMECGMERVHGTRDWKNAMLVGAATGALVSAASSNNREKIVIDAIAGGSIAKQRETNVLHHLACKKEQFNIAFPFSCFTFCCLVNNCYCSL
ncbi:hypothetical protein MKX01_004564 [Papaver californicum]|nr:hypothetical protein MKX01_004564 [Papaver californicum]